jgi:hypothetical protein
MTLRTKFGLTIVPFFAGGLAIAYVALAYDERLAALLFVWVALVALVTLALVRCPRCKWPVLINPIARLGRMRVWLWVGSVPAQCPKCHLSLIDR